MTTQATVNEGAGWLGVASTVSPLGVYQCTLLYDGVVLRNLDRAEALAYATEITWAITCASYDAAMHAQLSAVKNMKTEHVGWVIGGVRSDRRPMLAAATFPLEVEPIVSRKDLVGRVNFRYQDQFWTLELEDARNHVAQVLEVSAAVDMDAAYYQRLTGFLGLPEGSARSMVSFLRNHLPGYCEV